MFLFFMKNDPDDFDHLLHEWNEMPAPGGRLAGPVWQRIEEASGRNRWFGSLAMRLQELEASFSRPQFIAAVVAVALLVGMGFAELRTRYDATQADTEMSARYLSLLDVNNR
jgi:hypothetical protein